MKAKHHLKKARRFMASAKRLHPVDDYEAVMWANMHICTHWINAVFHKNGLTAEDYDFEHTWHLERCDDPERIRAGLNREMQTLLDALTVFEALRTAYVRGPAPYGPEILERSYEDLDRVQLITQKYFPKL